MSKSQSAATALTPEIDLLVKGEHADPHHVLGAHGAEVRAWRPDATAMRVVTGEGKRVDMRQVHPAGFFVGELSDLAEHVSYRLEADYPDGVSIAFEDPYRFWPSVGELDLYLFGEGRHHRLWEVLGARTMVHQGVHGTAFSVWAPNARSVRVVGDFNL